MGAQVCIFSLSLHSRGEWDECRLWQAFVTGAASVEVLAVIKYLVKSGLCFGGDADIKLSNLFCVGSSSREGPVSARAEGLGSVLVKIAHNQERVEIKLVKVVLYIYKFLLLPWCFVQKSGMSSCPRTDVSHAVPAGLGHRGGWIQS